MDRQDTGRLEGALMLALFTVTLAVIVAILLVVGVQIHNVVSAVSGGANQSQSG